MHTQASPEAIRGVRTKTSAAAGPSSPTARVGSPEGLANAAGGHDLEREIEDIERSSLDVLRIRWRNLSGRLAPMHLSRSLLARVLAYRVQAQVYGDIDRNAAKALARWKSPEGRTEANGHARPAEANDSAEGASSRERRISEPLILRSGTLLLREWQGRMETVMVVADGFAWNGEIFASLSAVAQRMTGTKWNGHRFFGVRPEDRSLRGSIKSGDPSAERGANGYSLGAPSSVPPKRQALRSTIAATSSEAIL